MSRGLANIWTHRLTRTCRRKGQWYRVRRMRNAKTAQATVARLRNGVVRRPRGYWFRSHGPWVEAARGLRSRERLTNYSGKRSSI